jgi:hypothetical protein
MLISHWYDVVISTYDCWFIITMCYYVIIIDCINILLIVNFECIVKML